MFTCSLHGAKNYPFTKCDGDLDIALADGTGDEAYLETLQDCLDHRLPFDTADIVFYLAGADPYKDDRLGRLSLSKSGLRRRDESVVEACQRWNLPLVIAMAGGYAKDLNDIVDIHATTVLVAMRLLKSRY